MYGDHMRREGVEAGAEDGARVEQHTEAPLDAVAHLCTYIHACIYGGGYIRGPIYITVKTVGGARREVSGVSAAGRKEGRHLLARAI